MFSKTKLEKWCSWWFERIERDDIKLGKEGFDGFDYDDESIITPEGSGDPNQHHP
jgi:hypothetical protein